MATIRPRPRKDGGITYAVLWRAGGTRTGKQESEIFPDNAKAAEVFKGLVDMHDQQWPPGWIRGRGFTTPEPAKGRDMPLMLWAARVVERMTGIDDRTRGDYRREIRLHFCHLVHTDENGHPTVPTVANVTSDDIKDWVRAEERGEPNPQKPDSWLRRPAAPKSISNRHGLLYAVFQAAQEASPPLRTDNPCARTKLPRTDGADDEMQFLETAEWQRLRAELALIQGGDCLDLCDVLIGTGMRWSEATALQVRDLNLTGRHPTVRIQRAWKRDDKNKKILGPPKTRKSRRTIGLPPAIVEIFRRCSAGKGPESYLLLNRGGRVWHESNFRGRRWAIAVKAAQAKGFPKTPRIHDLRHTHASWLIAANVPLPAIQARLGHESITTTVDRYGHLVRHLDPEIAAAVEAAMANDGGSELRLVR
ncbi:tyrosine-type recombinase/integrase [Kitasatospora purpeofusca]|uniref:tyrosine-type recombinase/integrase n=1 Tax=Kitasatospora purpeofusca TaxID=67352 RepID=UPI0035D7CC3E